MGLKCVPAAIAILLLTSSVAAAAKHHYSSPADLILMPDGGSNECYSCLEASRRAERAFKGANNLLKEFHLLSGEVCHSLPYNHATQCMEKSKKQIHHANQLLQEFFEEGSLCNITGLCATDKQQQQHRLQGDDVEIFVENEEAVELGDERACLACRRAVRDLLMKMKQPKMKTKIIEALIDYCEESEFNEAECKQTVYKYASTVLNKLEKLKPNDMCFMMGMCDEGVAMGSNLLD